MRQKVYAPVFAPCFEKRDFSRFGCRRFLLFLTFVIGVVLLCIMKRHQLLFALHTLPLLGSGQGHEAPVLRFASDGTFKISVYEDLHFGEGRSRHCHLPCLDLKSRDINRESLLSLRTAFLSVSPV